MIDSRRIAQLDLAIAHWMSRWGVPALRVSLGVIFIWFGILKPFGISPAQGLVEATVYWFPAEIFVPILGWWEVAIGVCLIVRPLIRVGILLLFIQMPGTVLPLVLLPDTCFTSAPYGRAFQYIFTIPECVPTPLVPVSQVIARCSREYISHHNASKHGISTSLSSS